ncbi:hypothetical protein MTO96_014118 [Rhipicephalus appendiculatus]
MCVLVRRGIAFVEHELNVASDIDGTLIEIIPSKDKTAGLYLLNVYSTASKKGLTHTFDGLFREAMAKASSKPLLICGDFNAPHTHWGYGSDSPKGRRLAELVDDLGLTLLNEPASHTRIGQGVCRDTTPDLSMIVKEQASNRKVRIVEWDKFGKTRDREKKEGAIQDIGAWCKEILADVEKATKEIEWMDWREKEAVGHLRFIDILGRAMEHFHNVTRPYRFERASRYGYDFYFISRPFAKNVPESVKYLFIEDPDNIRLDELYTFISELAMELRPPK